MLIIFGSKAGQWITGRAVCSIRQRNESLPREKVNLADAALNHGRMKCIRRQTLVNQGSIRYIALESDI